MKLFQIGYFLEVCRQGSISKAAEALYVSQPAVSVAIKELEDEFGVKLLVRQNNRITVTDAGSYVCVEGQRILDDAAKLVKDMQNMGDHVLIKIAAPPMISTLLFPDVYNGIRETFPKINIEIIECASLKARDLTAAGEADAAIAILDNIAGELLQSFVLFKTELVFCVNKRHPLARKKTISFGDFEGTPIIMMKEDSYQSALLRDRFTEHCVSPNILLYSSQLNTIKNFILKSDAGAFLFKPLADADSEIVALRLETPVLLDIGVVWRKDTRLYHEIRHLIEHIKNYTDKSISG
jgi:DNA-binding transcriptional LysR family regulator